MSSVAVPVVLGGSDPFSWMRTPDPGVPPANTALVDQFLGTEAGTTTTAGGAAAQAASGAGSAATTAASASGSGAGSGGAAGADTGAANNAAGAKPAASAPAGHAGTKTYVVKAGDTLSAIAQRYGTTWQKLQAANHIANADLIMPGQQLVIPGAGSAAGSATGAGGSKAGTKPSTAAKGASAGTAAAKVRQLDSLISRGESMITKWYATLADASLSEENKTVLQRNIVNTEADMERLRHARAAFAG